MAEPPRTPRTNRRRGRRTPDYAVAQIRLWGREVGAVAEDPQGNVTFEYEESFRSSGLEISPLRLPLTTAGPVTFPELTRIASFAGLPGVLADCLPDAFGNAVIRRYFEQQGNPNATLSPVQRLLYIGDRAMGALEFRPSLMGRASPATDEALEIARLVEEARRVIEGDASVAVPEMMQVGASAGGARAKALILWNRERGVVKSAFAKPDRDDTHWLLKFDGVSSGGGGHVMARAFNPGPFGRIEYAYSQMARSAGIEMAETHLLLERDYAHFMTQRFDRIGAERLHMHSLGGMHHEDYNVRQVLSYEDYFRTIRALKLGQPAVNDAFRRMTFNLAARNQDDHIKNVGFLMGPDGAWRLAPAFDLTWAFGSEWTRTHQMTARGKDDGFMRDDLLAIGHEFDVPNDGADIMAAVEAALATWEYAAQQVDLERAWIDRIQSSFRHFAT